MSTQAIQGELAANALANQTSSELTKRKAGRPRKLNANSVNSNTTEDTQMNPTTEQTATKRIQNTVFDLKEFDNVKLLKDVELPKKPATLEEATAMVGGNTEKFLSVFYEGLVADAIEQERANTEGWKVANDDNTPGELYTGQSADEAKGDLINAAILSLAKMQGYNKDLSREKKRELKEKAAEFLRSNPAMLASIQS